MKKKWYQKPSNWFTILICCILIPILIVNCFILYQAHAHKDIIPSVFGYKPFIVLSGSMEKEIKKGDLIIVKITDPKKLEKGNIIAFRDAENTVTTHRIIEIQKQDGDTYFVTKGDNNNAQDQNLVEYEDVEGIYCFRLPHVGTILNSLASFPVMIAIIFGITLIFGASFYISMKKQRDQEHKEFLEYKKQKELEEKSSSENKK